MKLVAVNESDPVDATLDLARDGDHRAFETLIKRHQKMVFSIALRAMRNRSIAEEIAQDVFLSLYRVIGRIESEAHLGRWLRRATTNRCIDELRRSRELPLMEDPITSSHDDADFLLHKKLRAVVAALPPQQRLAVILRYQQELELLEISDTLEIPLNTVKSHLQRALAAIRRGLGVTQGELRAVPREIHT